MNPPGPTPDPVAEAILDRALKNLARSPDPLIAEWATLLLRDRPGPAIRHQGMKAPTSEPRKAS